MTIGCNIWMICLKLNRFFYGLSRMLKFSQFVWTPCYSVWDVFNNFLLIDATDRSKISSDQKRFLSHWAYTPFHFSRTLPYLKPRRTWTFLYFHGLHIILDSFTSIRTWSSLAALNSRKFRLGTVVNRALRSLHGLWTPSFSLVSTICIFKKVKIPWIEQI